MSSNPKLKFKYVVIKHPTDFAIHEAYADWNNAIIGVNGEPVTMYGYSPRELYDKLGSMLKDIETITPINGDCEDLYDTYDLIEGGAYDYSPWPNNKPKVIELVKK
jgi:hypothetical protein